MVLKGHEQMFLPVLKGKMGPTFIRLVTCQPNIPRDISLSTKSSTYYINNNKTNEIPDRIDDMSMLTSGLT